MKIAVALIVVYAIMIVVLSNAWPVASLFLVCGFIALGLVKVVQFYLPRYHARVLWKLVEAELKLEEQNEPVS